MSADEQSHDERERRKRSTDQSPAAARIANQAGWVDQQIRLATERGDFDDLPGAGKPIRGLGSTHDPDWWLKNLIEREQITVLPMSVQLRREDADLDARLDTLTTEKDVRRVLADFSSRVVAARYRSPEGPPLVTMPRDVESEVVAWRERREARLAEHRARVAAAPGARRRRRWWRAR